MIIEAGLRAAGEIALADEVSDRFRRLCERSGFAENFDALTGEGLRDRAYTWTASVYLLMADDASRRAAERSAGLDDNCHRGTGSMAEPASRVKAAETSR